VKWTKRVETERRRDGETDEEMRDERRRGPDPLPPITHHPPHHPLPPTTYHLPPTITHHHLPPHPPLPPPPTTTHHHPPHLTTSGHFRTTSGVGGSGAVLACVVTLARFSQRPPLIARARLVPSHNTNLHTGEACDGTDDGPRWCGPFQVARALSVMG